ncbi:MAG: hypothetical protein IAE78_27915, partial [Myxococcus sp.]|nr:hypothetical protein [Myxococcus sp.]
MKLATVGFRAAMRLPNMHHPPDGSTSVPWRDADDYKRRFMSPPLQQEALRVLTAEFDGHTGRIPPSLAAAHVLRATEGGDFALQKAAADALLRRIRAVSDEWRLVNGRRGGRPRAGGHGVIVARGRRYEVWVVSFSELSGSCDCADFARNSLGLCKHLWWVLEQGFDAHGNASDATRFPRTLEWNPVRPLTGEGDWLARVRWHGEGRAPWPFDAQGNLETKSVRAPARRFEVVDELLKAQGLDTALDALLRREHALLERRLEFTPSALDIKRALKKLRQPLFPYQATGVSRFLEVGRLLLADDMGLGKTAQAIASCHVLHATGRVKKGLVVVPAALKTQWLREWKHFTHVPASIVEGPPSSRLRQYRALDSGFLIINYEQVLKDLPALEHLAPDLVVLDEAQR